VSGTGADWGVQDAQHAVQVCLGVGLLLLENNRAVVTGVHGGNAIGVVVLNLSLEFT
jgi:hypothetical protein